jgi:hypothetical protein
VNIGELELETAVPEDLDDRLISSTGMSAAEIGRALAAPCSAQLVASALEPMLTAPMHRVTLTRLIANAGVERARRQVAKLYGTAPARKKGRRRGR